MVDWLANEGVRSKFTDICCWWEEVRDDRMRDEFSERTLLIEKYIRISNDIIFHFMSMKHKYFAEVEKCMFSQESSKKIVIGPEDFYSKGKNYEEMG